MQEKKKGEKQAAENIKKDKLSIWVKLLTKTEKQKTGLEYNTTTIFFLIPEVNI